MGGQWEASARWSVQGWKPPRDQDRAGSRTSAVDLRCHCFSMFSLFSCLLACLWDLLLSRVADEAFYRQPFADVIGYVYVAKLIPCFDSISCLELMLLLCHKMLCILKYFKLALWGLPESR